jgi:radical SAM superfamily enzyme YgiQ (UPF0313 family)
MKITLVNPARVEGIQQFRWGVGHLGLAYLAAVLESSGHECSVIEAKYHVLSPDKVEAEVLSDESDLVGITAMTHEIHIAHDIAARIKRASSHLVTVVGGPHATALPERTLQEFPAFDFAVSGEGENTLLEIVKHCESGSGSSALNGIKGCAFRQDGRAIVNEPRPFMDAAELDALPFPAWHLFPDQPFPQFAGRGCPYRCAFCMRVLGNKVRMRSPQSVIAEIKHLHLKFNKRSSWFQDETFGVNKRWTREFLDLLEEFREDYQVDWTWKANSRVNIADYEMYQRMHDLGCQGLDFGIESGNVEILKHTQKDITPEMALQAISWAKQAGMLTNAFFIIGHPNETISSALDTIKFAAKLNADKIAVGVMVPYPGTKVWSMAQQNEGGYMLLSEDWRLYDKYFGEAIRFENISENKLKLLQSLCYFWYYVRNMKLTELIRFLKSHSAEAFKMLTIILGRKRRSPSQNAMV